MTNTIIDLLATAQDSHLDIACPACGTAISVTQQGSYELQLTPNARKEINDVLSVYRRFLVDLEEHLQVRNLIGAQRDEGLPYPFRDGLPDDRKTEGRRRYDNSFVESLGSYLEQFDYYQRREFISAVPQLRTLATDGAESLDDSEVTDEAGLDQVFHGVLLGLEPNLIVGPICDLILAQRHIVEWVNSLTPNDNMKTVNGLLEVCCPNITEYLDHLDAAIEPPQQTAAATPPAEFQTQPPAGPVTDQPADLYHLGKYPKELVRANLRRVRFVLALLLGHRAENCEELSWSMLRYRDAYCLPRDVQVRSSSLIDVLAAPVLLRRDGLGLSEDFRSRAAGRTGAGRTGADPAAVLSDLAQPPFGEELQKVVRFVCTGDESSLPRDVNQHGRPKQPAAGQITGEQAEVFATDLPNGWSSGQVWFEMTKPAQCGWYPKEHPTHGVVLIGGPGVGKSMIMTSGLTMFVRCAPSLGFGVDFDRAEDHVAYDAYTKLYWEGRVPDPTPVGTRHSVGLTVESTSDPRRRTHFVFSDIPGEIVANSVQAAGTHPIITNTLRHARVVIFVLDLGLETDFRNALTRNTLSDGYPDVETSAQVTMADRRGKHPTGPPSDKTGPDKTGPDKTGPDKQSSKKQTAQREEPVSSAEVGQFALLYKLIADLRTVRQRDTFDDVDLLLVVSKSDTYVDEAFELTRTGPERFLTDFYRRLYQAKVLFESPYAARNSAGQATKGDAGQSLRRDDLRSVGGIGSTLAKAGLAGNDSAIQAHLDVLQQVSTLAAASLATLGQAEPDAVADPGPAAHPATTRTGQDTGTQDTESDDTESRNATAPDDGGWMPTDPEMHILGARIRNGLVQRLRAVFGRDHTYFLPVSAQGRTLQVGDPKQLDNVPNQKLSEFVFAAPCLLLLRKEEKTATRD